MDKPFKTIGEQVSLLELRGMEIDIDAETLLMRNGYYSIVNGYKDPFIDANATNAAGDDRFRPGTKFSDLYSLFCFDRDLRERTFHYLIRAEATMRTACSYVFSDRHRGPGTYLVQGNFATEEEYAACGMKNYMFNMQTLHDHLFKTLNRSRSQSIVHYREEHGDVPLWVLATDLS